MIFAVLVHRWPITTCFKKVLSDVPRQNKMAVDAIFTSEKRNNSAINQPILMKFATRPNRMPEVLNGPYGPKTANVISKNRQIP